MQEKIIEYGIVSDLQNGNVEIKLDANENCKECSAAFCRRESDSSKSLIIENHPELKKGDHVSISILGRNLLRASLNLYLYPLMILIASIFIGMKLFSESINAEVNSFLIGFALMILYYFAFFKISKNLVKHRPNISICKIK